MPNLYGEMFDDDADSPISTEKVSPILEREPLQPAGRTDLSSELFGEPSIEAPAIATIPPAATESLAEYYQRLASGAAPETPITPTTEAPERGIIGDIASAAVRGVGVRLPEEIGHFLKGIDRPGGVDVLRDVGEKLTTFGKEAPEKFEFLRPSKAEEESIVRRGVTGALESAPVSVAPVLGGAAAGAAIGSVVPVIGTAIGAAAGAILTTLGFYGASAYNRGYEEAKEFELSDEEAHDFALKQGVISGGVEAAAAPVELLTAGFGKFFTKPAKEVAKGAIRSFLKTPIKQTAMGMLKTAPVELATELTQLGLEIKTRKEAGLPTIEFKEGAKEVFGPTIGMTLLFGVGVHGLNSQQQKKMAKALTDPATDEKTRQQAADYVAGKIGEDGSAESKDLALRWRTAIGKAIQDKTEFSIDSDIAEFAAIKAKTEAIPKGVAEEIVNRNLKQKDAEYFTQVFSNLPPERMTEEEYGKLFDELLTDFEAREAGLSFEERMAEGALPADTIALGKVIGEEASPGSIVDRLDMALKTPGFLQTPEDKLIIKEAMKKEVTIEEAPVVIGGEKIEPVERKAVLRKPVGAKTTPEGGFEFIYEKGEGIESQTDIQDELKKDIQTESLPSAAQGREFTEMGAEKPIAPEPIVPAEIEIEEAALAEVAPEAAIPEVEPVAIPEVIPEEAISPIAAIEEEAPATAAPPFELNIENRVAKLDDPNRQIIEAIKVEVESGEAGKRVPVTAPTGEVLGMQAEQGTFPEYFQNKGYKKKTVLNIINKTLEGKKLTQGQEATIRDLHDGFMRFMPDQISALEAEPVIPGEAFELAPTPAAAPAIPAEEQLGLPIEKGQAKLPEAPLRGKPAEEIELIDRPREIAAEKAQEKIFKEELDIDVKNGTLNVEETKTRLKEGLYVHDIIPQSAEQAAKGSNLEAASNVARRSLRSDKAAATAEFSQIQNPIDKKSPAAEIRAAETEALRQFAEENDLLIPDFEANITREGNVGGGEAYVYYDAPSDRFIKANFFALTPTFSEMFDRVMIHNFEFEPSAYRFEGFADVKDEFLPIFSQPNVKETQKIDGEEKEKLAAETLKKRGYKEIKDAYPWPWEDITDSKFINSEGVVISDINARNLVYVNGEIVFIDPIIEMDSKTKTARIQESIEPTEAELPFERAKIGRSPQPYKVLRELEATPEEVELGERFVEIENEKTGEVQTVEFASLTPIKRIVSKEALKKARGNIKEKMKGLKAGIDPTLLADYAVIGAYHFETGLRNFSVWSKKMVDDFGEEIKPHLDDLWKRAKAGIPRRADIAPSIEEKAAPVVEKPVAKEKPLVKEKPAVKPAPEKKPAPKKPSRIEELKAKFASENIEYNEVSDGKDMDIQRDDINPRKKMPESSDVTDHSFTMPEDSSRRRGLDWFVFKAQDKFNSLKKVQEAIQEKTGIEELPEHMDTYLAEERYHGMARAELDDFNDDHIQPLIDAVHEADLDLQEVEAYLYARHAPEANKRLKGINPDRKDNEALSGMDNQEAADIMAHVKEQGKKSQLEAIGKRIDAINNARLDLMVKEGLATKQEIAAWKEAYEFYIPLKRQLKDKALPKRGMGLDIRGKEGKVRGGSKLRAENILANVISQYEATAIRAEKAKVGKALYNLVKENPNPELWTIDEPEYRAELRKGNKETDSAGVVVYTPDRLQDHADNVLGVKIDGEEHLIRFNKNNIHAMRIASAMKNMSSAQNGFAVNMAGKLNRWLAMVNTTMNPEFIISNFVRDFQTAGFNINDTKAGKVQGQIFKDLPKAWKGAWDYSRGKTDTQWAKHFREFRDAGGQTGWVDFYKDIEHRQDELVGQLKELKPGKTASVRKSLRVTKEWIEDLNGATENAIRLSAFVHARKMGISVAKSASIAKNLTVNFNRKGDMGQVFNAFYLFFNAGIQGSARLILAAKNSPKVRKMMVATVGFAVMLDMMNRALGGEDDDGEPKYDKVPDWVKDHNLIIMNPDGSGNYFKIPLPWGYNTLHILGQGMAGAMDPNKKDFNAGKEMSRMVGGIFSAFNPLGSEASLSQWLSPTITDPIIQWGENKDFAGRKLRPDQSPFDVPRPEYQLHWNSTRDTSKWLAKTLNELGGGDVIKPSEVPLTNVSPALFDLIWNTFTGGAGRFVSDSLGTPMKALAGEEISTHKVPFARKIYGEISSWQAKEDFYKKFDEIRFAKKQLDYYTSSEGRDLKKAREIKKEYRGELRLEKTAKTLRKKLRKLKDKKERINVSDWSLERKRAGKKRIEEQEKQLISSFNRKYQRLTGD